MTQTRFRFYVIALMLIALMGIPVMVGKLYAPTVRPDTTAFVQGGDIEGAKERALQRTEDDTVVATPWVGEIVAAWKPGTLRLFCMESYATWPYFLFIRHLRELKPEPNASCAGSTPYFLQGDKCPQSVNPPTPADFVLVQCGPALMRQYNRTAAPKAPVIIGGNRA